MDSFTVAGKDNQQANGSYLSSRTENVQAEEVINIPHASDTFKHRDPSGVPGNKQGREHSRKQRRTNSRSSGCCGPASNPSNPTGNGKDPERTKTSGKELTITAETLLADCQKELEGKMTVVTEQHTKKIDGVSGLLGRLRVSKHIRVELLNEYA